MKNKKGNIAVITIIIIVVAITSVIFGWFFAKKVQTSDQKEIAQSVAKVPPAPPSLNEIDNWTKYANEELGISFSYPKEWGEIKKAEFDNTKKYEYFVFDSLKNSQLGGLHRDYWNSHPGRGGSLIDMSGFTKNELETTYKRDNYKLVSSGNCAYSTNKFWFDGYVYHAVCNLKNNLMPGFNFGFGTNKEAPGISKEDFIKVIESVIVK